MESFAFLYKMICLEVIKQTQYLLKDVLRKEQKRLFLKRKETYEGYILGKLPLNVEAPAVVRMNYKFVHLTVFDKSQNIIAIQ